MKLDIIGDVHGCINELYDLFGALGYNQAGNVFLHPEGRLPVFVGDLMDRGPDSLAVIQLVYNMVVEKNCAHYVPGNHCNKLYRYFLGNPVKLQHGLETTVAEYQALSAKQKKAIRHHFMTLYEQAPLYLHAEEVNAVVAHAGIREDMIGKSNKKVERFVLYGDITGEFHPDGRPVRRDWAQHYRGKKWVVYGHTPVINPRILNKTINIDTGCVFGNKLTAFRLPEEETFSVPSSLPFQKDKFNNFNE